MLLQWLQQHRNGENPSQNHVVAKCCVSNDEMKCDADAACRERPKTNWNEMNSMRPCIIDGVASERASKKERGRERHRDKQRFILRGIWAASKRFTVHRIDFSLLCFVSFHSFFISSKCVCPTLSNRFYLQNDLWAWQTVCCNCCCCCD